MRVSEEMKLPEGTTCADCCHLKRCQNLFGCKPENTECDFFPIRFARRLNDSQTTTISTPDHKLTEDKGEGA